MPHEVTSNIDWIFFRPLKILVRTSITKENCLSAVIIDVILKVIGQIKPKSFLGNTNLHSQYERKASRKTSS